MAYIIKHGFTLQEVGNIGNSIHEIIISHSPSAGAWYSALIIKRDGTKKIAMGEDGGRGIISIGSGTTLNISEISGSGFRTQEKIIIGEWVAADSSAQAQINSTTTGFLPPRMTTTQKNAISSPATGLTLYDTTLNKLCVYTGSAWETITSA